MGKIKTPLLFEVPKTHPSKKEKMEAFKKLHGIETHYAGKGWTREDHPWSACLMPRAREIAAPYVKEENPNLFDLVANAARLLEEAGVLVTGETERDAIRNLCEDNKIQCDL